MTFTRFNAPTLGGNLECILYGVYVVLFILYLILWRRNNRKFNEPLTLAHILLFCLCTLFLCFDISMNYFAAVQDAESDSLGIALKLNLGSLLIFAMIDYVAQMILLYRCWIIWGRRWVVVALPGFLALVTFGGGIALVDLFSSPLRDTDEARAARLYRLTGIATNSISLAVNALTTLLIISKIFLTSREVRFALGSNSHRSLHIAAAMLVESGLLILTFQLVFVILFNQVAFDIISGPTTQIYGITPTLLNIRVVMGSAYETTIEKTRTLRFAHSEGGAATQTTGQSMIAAGVQSRGVNTELNDVPNNESAADDAV
ncbi:hypothetical protein BD779DRAFT_1010686 [Infundibulicybe gibba]|nr:hypothetical protein BD779DRAFT_1010686 [Infundibulicybe gibba]